MYSKIKGVKDIDKTMLLNTGKQQKDLVRKDFTSVCCRMHLAENAMNPKENSTYRDNRDWEIALWLFSQKDIELGSGK